MLRRNVEIGKHFRRRETANGSHDAMGHDGWSHWTSSTENITVPQRVCGPVADPGFGQGGAKNFFPEILPT